MTPAEQLQDLAAQMERPTTVPISARSRGILDLAAQSLRVDASALAAIPAEAAGLSDWQIGALRRVAAAQVSAGGPDASVKRPRGVQDSTIETLVELRLLAAIAIAHLRGKGGHVEYRVTPLGHATLRFLGT